MIDTDEQRVLAYMSTRMVCGANDLGQVVAPPGLNKRQTSALGVKIAFSLRELGYADKIYDRKTDRYNYIITARGEKFLERPR